jgi:hypothetical protein
MFREKEVTIYDLAEKLDISIATVSRALKNDPVVVRKRRRKFSNWPKNALPFQSFARICGNSKQIQLVYRMSSTVILSHQF